MLIKKLGLILCLWLAWMPAQASSQLSNNNPQLQRFADLHTAWTIDNWERYPILLNSDLRDLGWHIAKLTVTAIGKDTPPTPVQGISAIIYPYHTPDYGQQIEIRDLDCQTAVFGKVGDACFIYFRLNYDQRKGSPTEILFPVQMTAANPQLSSLLQFVAPVHPSNSTTILHFAYRVESEFYAAPAIQANPKYYQVLVVENGGSQPIQLTNLSLSNNNYDSNEEQFRIKHRSNDNFDPYYSYFPECSMETNPNLNQTNQLSHMFEQCIIVFAAPETSIHYSSKKSTLELQTSARFTFPPLANKIWLVAHYVNALPNLELTQLAGTIQQNILFDRYHLTITFTSPKLADIVTPDFLPANTFLLNDGVNIHSGERVIIAERGGEAHDVTIGNVAPQFPDGMLLPFIAGPDQQNNFWSPHYLAPSPSLVANIGFDQVEIRPNKQLTQQQQLYASFKGHFHSGWSCVWDFAQNLTIPFNGRDIVISQAVKKDACAGGPEPGSSSYRASVDSVHCEDGVCRIVLKIYGDFGQHGGFIHNNYYYWFAVEQPTSYLLINEFTPQLNMNFPQALYLRSPTIQFGLGNSNICPRAEVYLFRSENNDNFIYYIECNGDLSRFMNYAISLLPGQQFVHGTISFDSSMGNNILDKFSEELYPYLTK